MKTNIKFFAVIAVLVIGFFLPLVLVALGFAFSWTIAIVAGIACEIGVSRMRKTRNRSRGL